MRKCNSRNTELTDDEGLFKLPCTFDELFGSDEAMFSVSG